MKQAVMTSPGAITFREIPKPAPGPGDVLIKIMRIGVCGSDIHVYHGKHPYTSYPVVQGHEVSGEVAAIGEGVCTIRPGDRVTIMPQVVCGECYSCRHGAYHICDNLKVMGFQTIGAASEYFAVNADKIITLPAGMSFDHGAIIEPLAVAVHALSRAGDIHGRKVLVIGAGPIGNLIAQTARAMGAKCVMITDISAYRLSIAKACGIDGRVNVIREDLDKRVMEFFGPDRMDVTLECVGAENTMSQSVTSARKGSDIIVVGVFGDKPRVDMGLVQDRELRLIGTLMYQKADYLAAVDLILKDSVSLSPLITRHFPFNEYDDAYRFIETQKDRSLKVMIDIN
ncbi:MAG TPA: alcohol dehydrogenase [Spirochaetes bacterium]|nr:alcohol dehydrogenase [Spirochaetota bacterium]